MNCYHVIGDHGCLADQYIDRMVIAQNHENAKILFINYVKRHFELYWSSMGEHNIHIYKQRCKNES